MDSVDRSRNRNHRLLVDRFRVESERKLAALLEPSRGLSNVEVQLSLRETRWRYLRLNRPQRDPSRDLSILR